jgi:polar amino acid transport system permease protein
VNYVFHFGDMWNARDEFIAGTLMTLRLSALAMVASLAIAIVGAFVRTSGPQPLRFLVAAYVEFIRNTPFLVQIFMIFFGLPTIGLRLDADNGALIALILNGSAYTIEIVRAGIENIGHGQMEGAMALGLHRLQAFRLVILPQALRIIVPPLGSQFILLMLNSSVCAAISADELTSAALDIQGRTFRAFEAFIVAGAIYFVLSLVFSALLAGIERMAFGQKVAR